VDSLVAAGCIISGSCVLRSLLFTSVRTHSYSEVTDSVILTNSEVGRRAKLNRVIVDHNCKVPPGLEVGFDAELDARRFYRTEDGITLITQSMLARLEDG
jgi:glucose-1-phosphate adenylyltransferase